MSKPVPDVCGRLSQIRREHYGPRGRSRFARDLGLTPSTYAHYEIDRLPPVDVLWKAARLTRTRLEWLVAGGDERHESTPTPRTLHADRLAERLRELLIRRPELLPQVEVYLTALMGLPAGGPREHLPAAAPAAAEMIPVIGSTSAGTARFWREIPDAGDGPVSDARLETLLAACTGPAAQARAQFAPGAASGPVSLIQYSRPDDRGLLEFLTAPDFRRTHPRCVAWRVDGESMQPRYCDGDFVIASSDAPAESGHPCIARQRGQLGVNCKLYQEEGDEVVLIPVNDAWPVQRLPRSEIEWAWRVLASVRL